MEPDERRATVLRAIVEEYVETAQPVGSQTIARSRALGVSSATVRNDMTQLEREGYIAQPHTSAGRIPTDLGYRFFVDHFARQQTLAPTQKREVAEFFASAHSALEDLLNETSHLLAGITRHAAMVVGPGSDIAKLRSVQLVGLQGGHVLVVAVYSNGAVDKDVLILSDEPTEDTLRRATEAIDVAMRGHAAGSAPPPAPTGDHHADALARAAHETLVRHARVSHEPLYVGGTSRIAAEHEAFSTVESAARLLELLEQQVVVVSLVRDVLDDGVTVRIGTENRVDELRECSLVLAPYTVEGHLAGTVGVLGPTRMDYQQALAAVAAVSHQLGKLLSP